MSDYVLEKIMYRLKQIELQLASPSALSTSESDKLKSEQTELIVQLRNDHGVDYFDVLKVEAFVGSSDKPS